MIELPERVLNKLAHIPEDTDSCWNWIGAYGNGVPKIMDKGTQNAVHVRQLIFRYVSNIPYKQRAIWCRNRGCVNPWHMDPYANRRPKYARWYVKQNPDWYKNSTFKCGHPVKHPNIHASGKQYNGNPIRHCNICFWKFFGKYYGRDYSAKIALIEKGLRENPGVEIKLPRNSYTRRNK